MTFLVPQDWAYSHRQAQLFSSLCKGRQADGTPTGRTRQASSQRDTLPSLTQWHTPSYPSHTRVPAETRSQSETRTPLRPVGQLAW